MNVDKIVEHFLLIQYREVKAGITEVSEGSVHWLTSERSWTAISVIPGALTWLSGELAAGTFSGHNTIWFSEEDPLLGMSKPVTVITIALSHDGGYILEVIGQKSDRIKRKWERKYSDRMRGVVTMVWREEP